jgi:histidyl-tRNA synthetase
LFENLKENETFNEGIEELAFVMDQLAHLPDHAVKADLSIVRGLDYYTGTVYETRLLDIPEFTSSVCSGGRYDDLAGSYINKHLPGVGISIGFTRLFDVLRHNGYIKNTKKSPTDVLVILPSEDMRATANETAHALRQNGHNVEVYHAPQKINKQFQYAEKKGIPYVWFPDLSEVKNLETGEQLKADAQLWQS